jgi:toxin ParE1/3/4
MPNYIITEKALEDINAIWQYTAENWSIEQANRYYNLLLDEIEYIAQNYTMARDFGNIRKSYRCSKVNSHLIFFKRNNQHQIEVIRVLHERMDIKNKI